MWLYRALFRAGFANRAEATARNDGLVLRDALITAALRCAPPKNKPTPAQLARCAPFLDAELAGLTALRVVVGLGAIGTKAAASAALGARRLHVRRTPRFSRTARKVVTRARPGGVVTLLASYHPSRQNTNTGVLTEPMLDAIFTRARSLIAAKDGER